MFLIFNPPFDFVKNFGKKLGFKGGPRNGFFPTPGNFPQCSNSAQRVSKREIENFKFLGIFFKKKFLKGFFFLKKNGPKGGKFF